MTLAVGGPAWSAAAPVSAQDLQKHGCAAAHPSSRVVLGFGAQAGSSLRRPLGGQVVGASPRLLPSLFAQDKKRPSEVGKRGTGAFLSQLPPAGSRGVSGYSLALDKTV